MTDELHLLLHSKVKKSKFKKLEGTKNLDYMDMSDSERKNSRSSICEEEEEDEPKFIDDNTPIEETAARRETKQTTDDDNESLASNSSLPSRLRNIKRPNLNYNHVFREYSQTPSLIEIEKSRENMERMELLNMSLHQLARDGDVIKMGEILSMCKNASVLNQKVNELDEDGLTALHYAARYNHFKVVKLLVECKATVDYAGSEDKITPLHFAARYKRVANPSAQIKDERKSRSLGDMLPHSVPLSPTPDELRPGEGKRRRLSVSNMQMQLETESIITYLVHHGADPNTVDAYGMTPLHYAAMRGNAVVAQELLRCPDIIVDAIDKEKMTPLHAVCTHGWKEVAEVLLKAGADIEAVDAKKATPLHYACQEGHVVIVRLLFEHALELRGRTLTDISKESKVSETDPLFMLLMSEDYERNTPLLLAVDNGHLEIVKILLNYGANPNAYRVLHNTALHCACITGDLKIVQLLVKRKAAISAKNSDQITPLHLACGYNNVSIVDFLIKKGAKLEATDRDGSTPLLIAAFEGHSETISLLLSLGADVHAMDKSDKSAIYLATEYNRLSALKILLKDENCLPLVDKSDRYNTTPLHIAARDGYIDCLKCLLEAGARIDSKNEEEWTPLHMAASSGRTRIVRELVRRSKLIVADENEKSDTPLHIAATEGHEMVVRELIDSGANIAARNSYLWTALDCAAAHGWVQTCKILLDLGAPLDPMDKSRTTPVHLASREGHVDVVKLLIKRGASVALTDDMGKNCLDMAIDNSHTPTALAIVRSKQWREALRSSRPIDGPLLFTTPLRQLIKYLPDVAEAVFDNCTTSHFNQDHPDYEINFDFEFLDDSYQRWNVTHDDNSSLSSKTVIDPFDALGNLHNHAEPYTRDSDLLKNNHPLMIMVQSERENLLSHPLVTALLRHKWNCYGRHVYYSSLLLYALFLSFLTIFIVETPAPFMFQLDPNRTLDFDALCAIERAKGRTQNLTVRIGTYVIWVLTAAHVLKELFQMYQKRWNYIGWENLIEWFVYSTALVLVWDFSDCSRATGLRHGWQWQMGAVCIFFAWINLVLFIRKFPRFGIYVVMFVDIFRTFARFFVVFLLFVVAFALAFFALFQNHPTFGDVQSSLLKTTVMMIGEFEYDDLFNSHDGSFATTVFYSNVSHGLFIIFVLIMTILIMNLLIGLAVDDIKGVQSKAVLRRFAMLVELVLHVEQAVPEKLRRRWMVRKSIINPTKKPLIGKFRRLVMGGEMSQLSKAKIAVEINKEKDEVKQLRFMQERTSARIETVRQRVDQMQNQQQRLHSMMKAVIDHFDIPWEDQDEFIKTENF